MNPYQQTPPPQLSEARALSRWAPILGWALAFAGITILFLLDPAQYTFYPRCQFHAATGLDCPGCGALRALHQLLHGHIGAAFRLNALVVLSLPLLSWLAARWGRRKLKHQPAPLTISATWLWCACAVTVGFGILRNLPFVSLARLAP